ncbi:MAG: hypothetical protein ACPGD8_09030, partial [Flavobacteriales bacterium]
MTKDELVGLFDSSQTVTELTTALKAEAAKIRLRGIAGSGYSFVASEVIKKSKDHHVFVLSDKEAAAYFLSDLE